MIKQEKRPVILYACRSTTYWMAICNHLTDWLPLGSCAWFGDLQAVRWVRHISRHRYSYWDQIKNKQHSVQPRVIKWVCQSVHTHTNPWGRFEEHLQSPGWQLTLHVAGYLSWWFAPPLGDKVSMLTHIYPHKARRKIEVIICKITRLTAHFMCGLMSDLLICTCL